MTYLVTGLAPEPFLPLAGLGDAALAARGARRVIASADSGYPCRITLADARAGEQLILLNHVSHDVPGPFRHAFAIYLRVAALKAGQAAARYHDRPAPVFAGRPLALRGFAADGMLHAARLAAPGEADAAIRALFADPGVAYIHAHNAAHGCFAARIDREGPQP